MPTGDGEAAAQPWSTWRVGDRVVVRYRRDVPAPGEPPLTDALGDVVAVGPEGVTVRTRRGDVAVPAEAIVLGKRVPPARRPPARRGAGQPGGGPQTTRFHG